MKPAERMWLFCIALMLIGSIGPLAIDMYAPAMPAEAKALMASTQAIKMSLSLYLIVAFFGLLFYGALSDCFGRKRMLLIGLGIGTVGSIICMLAPSIHVFYIGRIAQGLGFSATPAILPAMSRDIFEGKRLAQASSMLSMAMGIAPLLSPVIGAHIDHSFGWRMIFVVLAAYAIIAVLVTYFGIPETHHRKKRNRCQLLPMLKTYGYILREPIFLKNMFSKSAAFACFIIFYTVTPFMLEDHLHLNALQYGWITLSITGAVLLSKSVNTWLLGRIKVETLVFLSNCLLLVASGIMLVFAFFHLYSINAIVGPFVIMSIGCGFLFSNTTAAAFESFEGMSSGSVAGLLNGMQRLFAYIGSIIAAHLIVTSLLPLALLMTGLSAFAVLQYMWFSRSVTSQKSLVRNNSF